TQLPGLDREEILGIADVLPQERRHLASLFEETGEDGAISAEQRVGRIVDVVLGPARVGIYYDLHRVADVVESAVDAAIKPGVGPSSQARAVIRERLNVGEGIRNRVGVLDPVKPVGTADQVWIVVEGEERRDPRGTLVDAATDEEPAGGRDLVAEHEVRIVQV